MKGWGVADGRQSEEEDSEGSSGGAMGGMGVNSGAAKGEGSIFDSILLPGAWAA